MSYKWCSLAPCLLTHQPNTQVSGPYPLLGISSDTRTFPVCGNSSEEQAELKVTNSI